VAGRNPKVPTLGCGSYDASGLTREGSGGRAGPKTERDYR